MICFSFCHLQIQLETKKKKVKNIWQFFTMLGLITDCKYMCINHRISKIKAQGRLEKEEKKENTYVLKVTFSK